jgi:signal transduction histidine kinase
MNAVLLVDDERDFVDLLAQRLSARGFSVRTAYDGEQALALSAGQEPDVAVLDIGLPGMDGLALLAELKRLRPAVEALMLTGQNDLATAVAGMKLGAADYLVKPVPIERLVEAISRAQVRRQERLESYRMAETAKMAALGHMAEGVAHEINNPVNTMASLAGWMGDLAADLREGLRGELGGALPKSAAATLAEMDTSGAKLSEQARRVKAITAKLLCLCHKPRSASLEILPGGGQKVELGKLVGELLEERAARIQAAGITAQASIDPSLPPLMLPGSGLPGADLATALGNILDNALDAMPGGGRLDISAEALAADIPGGSARIVIADTGHGIPPAHLPRVFEPFFSTREVGQGTGLGLTVSYGTVKSLGGDIEIESAPGKGTHVVVTLPLR